MESVEQAYSCLGQNIMISLTGKYCEHARRGCYIYPARIVPFRYRSVTPFMLAGLCLTRWAHE